MLTVPLEQRHPDASRSPEIFRPGYKADKVCKKYKPEEFGVDAGQQWQEPFNVFQGMQCKYCRAKECGVTKRM